VTDALLCSNVAAFVVGRNRERLVSALAKSNARLAKGQLYRLATSCMLHANFAHLLVNCLSLSNIGPSVEHFFGTHRFAVLYTAAGISGNLLSWGLGRAPISVGASGAIFGLVGGWGVFLATNKDVLERNGFRNIDESLGSLAQMCALNLALGLAPGSHLDNFGHIGGFIGGAACAGLIGPRLRLSWISEGGRQGLVDEPILQLPQRKPPQRKPPQQKPPQRKPPQLKPPPRKSVSPFVVERKVFDSIYVCG
jgi:membrane associated rhomboid family serine protease